MEIVRSQYKELLNRMIEPRKFIQVVVGARQIGKTTLIGQVIQKIKQPTISISADDVTDEQTLWINQQWETARIILKSQNAKYVVLVIDEIQKINNWSETVKKNWDADTKKKLDIRVILSGSSKLLIQDGLTESLAGRFELIKLPHWSLVEMQEAFDVTPEQYAYFGAYPGAATVINNENRWRNYVRDSLVETTISKDILMLKRIDKPALLKQLFELASSYSAQELSYNKIIGQLQNAGNTTTLTGYVNLLDSAQLLCGLSKYSNSQVLSRNSSPKFQVYNNAFFTLYNQQNFKTVTKNPVEWGRWVENIIGTHFINVCYQHDMQLFYWRDGHHEVDYILKYQNKVIAIEVKSGNKLKSSGLAKANITNKFYKTLLVGIEVLDWKTFLKLDITSLFK